MLSGWNACLVLVVLTIPETFFQFSFVSGFLETSNFIPSFIILLIEWVNIPRMMWMSYLVPFQPLVRQVPKWRLFLSLISLVYFCNDHHTSASSRNSTSGNDILFSRNVCPYLSVGAEGKKETISKRGALSIRTTRTPEAPRHPTLHHQPVHFSLP